MNLMPDFALGSGCQLCCRSYGEKVCEEVNDEGILDKHVKVSKYVKSARHLDHFINFY